MGNTLRFGAVVAAAALTGALAVYAVRGAGAGDAALSDAARSADGARAPARQAQGRRGFAPAIAVELASRERVSRTLRAIGEVRATQSAVLAAEAAGRVETVAFTPGDVVAEGDVLARFDDRAQRIALAEANAAYPIAKANADRFRALEAEEAASSLEADDAARAFAVAAAALERARYELAQREIRAPFDGVVGLTAIEPGDYVRVGDPIVSIDDLSAIVVAFAAPQEAADDLSVGQSVEISPIDGGAAISGRITAIDTRFDAASRTIDVEATAAASPNAPRPGGVVAVAARREGAPAVGVAGLAVQWDRSGAFVWRIAADGAAERARVRLMQREGERALVAGEVKPGEVIVSEGADRVRPGAAFPDYAVGGAKRPAPAGAPKSRARVSDGTSAQRGGPAPA
ncbi:MAG: efflux RND transporter periplasmic adaptor subunit [Parvularculaceae bacterium]